MSLIRGKEEDFDLVRMVESAYKQVFEKNEYVPKVSEVKDEITYGYYDIIYGYDAVAMISTDFISTLLLSKKHIHTDRGDRCCDAQMILIPNLYIDDFEEEGGYIAISE